MRNVLLLLLVIMVFAAFYFLSTGITGRVVSESCCFGDCFGDNKCQIGSLTEYPILFRDKSRFIVGVVFLLTISFFLIKK